MPVCPECRSENPELGAKCPRCADSYYVYDDAIDEAERDLYIGKNAAGKYVIVARISEGGMGTVYRALQLPVEREVAFKVLRAELEDNDDVRNRFTREARAVSKINHPNIITLHDFGFDDSDYPYMVMEYAPGMSLDEWIYQDEITLDRIVHVARQILSALADAHDQGVVHRDLKPENIMVTGTGTDQDFIKLLDFGIARIVNEQATEGLTREGEVFGTPHYMSPEQAEGKTNIGPAADVYAVGIMLYEMLCLESPFDAPKPLSILFKQINEELPPFEARPGVTIPGAVKNLVRRATAKEPEDRFADAGTMLQELERLDNKDSSGIVQAAQVAQQEGPQESRQTMKGTGPQSQTTPEQREKVATANTLGFEEASGTDSGINAPAADSGTNPPGNNVSVDDPFDEMYDDFDEGNAGDNRRKLALVGGLALLFVGLSATLFLVTGEKKGAAEENAIAEETGESDTGSASDESAKPSVAANSDTGSRKEADAGAVAAEESADVGGGDSGPTEKAAADDEDPTLTTSDDESAADPSSDSDRTDRSGGRPSSGGTNVGSPSPSAGGGEPADRDPAPDPTPEPTPDPEPTPTAESGDDSSGDDTKIEKFGAPEKKEDDGNPDKFGDPSKFGAPGN